MEQKPRLTEKFKLRDEGGKLNEKLMLALVGVIVTLGSAMGNMAGATSLNAEGERYHREAIQTLQKGFQDLREEQIKTRAQMGAMIQAMGGLRERQGEIKQRLEKMEERLSRKIDRLAEKIK